LFEICEDLGSLGEDNSRVFFKEMILALENMHKSGISHRDIKLENILVDTNLQVKIADLGFASQ